MVMGAGTRQGTPAPVTIRCDGLRPGRFLGSRRWFGWVMAA
jgi:hypothetical protein